MAMELFSRNFVNSSEQIQPLRATVKGQLPDWLKGDLIRVGPGQFDIGDDFTCKHWFDGLAVMYKFSIKDNKANYSKRFLQSDAYKKAVKFNRPIYTEFGTKAYPDPSKSFFSRMLSTFDSSAITDNGAINIINIGEELFVASETCYLRRVDQHTLETKEKVDLHKLSGLHFACSHVISDDTGSFYNIGMTLLSGPKYHVIKTGPSNNNKGKDVWLNTKMIATIPSSWKASYSYIHSFALTDNYIIFLEQPLLINTFKLATSQVKGRSLKECMEWHPQELVRFIVVNKKTGEVVKTKYISDEPFFVLHNINAYESNGQIYLDMATYKDIDIMENFFLEKVRNCCQSPCPCQLKRFVLPLIDDIQNHSMGEEILHGLNDTPASAVRATDNHRGDYVKITGKPIGKLSFDMPFINSNFRCKPYRFIYGCGGLLAPEGSQNSIIKTDLESGEQLMWRESDYQYPSEPVFVPRPQATEEDDGIILTSLIDTRQDKVDSLLVLDAQTFKEIARIEAPSSIPNGLHGVFIPSENAL